ncbi:MAG: acyl-CoA dehydrogenase family protein [Comamonas sp.]|uniref:acyl-CoA dehydrogenase family protein n=1 Tax=Comamonas sp. TaxID=34028 RepID=UPI0026478D6F|nr:acyl-CoA dehydrogenase family protein [Comamonas sp.]MDN5505146.1 acyl-CoA dehydrogenase family protein [Comamonas sp.]MDN5540458.1 acyl-CoA dehydrogenase family protein [Comamonas sp.]
MNAFVTPLRQVAAAQESTAPSARPSRTDILSGLPQLAAAIAPGAAQRELQREAPFAAFELLRASGIGALRIGREQGGPGGSIADVIEVVATLAAADSNVAHALRTHFNTTELLRLDRSPSPLAQRQIGWVLEGKLFGGAFTELGTARAGISTSTLLREGEHHRLNGKKYYATGTAYADYFNVFAVNAQEQGITAVIPVQREGVRVLDDWDGMGQRLTASGSVELDNVLVYDDEISPSSREQLPGRHASALRQLILVATAAGIVRNLFSDARHYVLHLGRPAMHSPAERSRDDHFVQAVVGELAAASYAIDQLVAENARQLDLGAEALLLEHEDTENIVLQGALATAKTQLIVSRLALNAAERLFEVGGASATSRKLNLDRHWRNLRTIFSHNPLLHKSRVVGDYELNGTRTHLEEGRVF